MPTLRDLMVKLGIERGRATVVPSGGERLEFNFEISPHEFVAQAALDGLSLQGVLDEVEGATELPEEGMTD